MGKDALRKRNVNSRANQVIVGADSSRKQEDGLDTRQAWPRKKAWPWHPARCRSIAPTSLLRGRGDVLALDLGVRAHCRDLFAERPIDAIDQQAADRLLL